MHDYVLRYAIDNIWCNPGQDKQYNYKLRRISHPKGLLTRFSIEKETYSLPKVSNSDVWHVFQIGRVHPALFNLPNTRNIWMPLTKLINDQMMDCEVFISCGIVFPRHETFILITSSGNLLVAIKENGLYPSFEDENIEVYLQLYSNTYFNSPRSFENRYKRIFSETVYSVEAVRQFQIRIEDHVVEKGFTPIYFVNGRMVSEISAATAQAGDTLECLIDGSIKKVVDFNINELKSFNSSLDSERKYILHYPGTTDIIDYLDDIEMYVYRERPNNPNLYNGLLFSRNRGNWLRMLTHKDYSVPISAIEAMMAERPEDPRSGGEDSRFPKDLWTNLDDLKIRLYIKHGGYDRPLVADANRTQDLYRLSSEDILRAMTGADAVAECWRAENLEKSRYIGFMGLEHDTVYPKGFGFNIHEHPNKEYVANYAADTLGYHSAAKLLNDSPLKRDPLYPNSFKLSYNHWENTTVFEYDSEGLLLGYYHHQSEDRYYPTNPECVLIEPVVGRGSLYISGFEGESPVYIPNGYNYRVYVKAYNEDKFTDVTESEDLVNYGYLDTTIPNEKVWRWTYNSATTVGYIRLDDSFLIKTMTFNKNSGMIRFNLDAFESVDNEYVNRELVLPFGQYDVWLNGKSLIENVDYTYRNNRFVLCNLEYLENINTVIVRGTGYCSVDLEPYKATESGFVEYGVLSSNNKFDVHTNKVRRIVVDGSVIHPKDVHFDELSEDEIMTNVRNGTPFSVTTPQSVFREVFKDDYEARRRDDVIDKDVSNYLDFYLPKRTRELVDNIERKYKVFSCSSNLLLHLLKTGKIKPLVENGRLNEEHALKSVANYEWIKRYDLVNIGYNNNHLYLYPHWHNEPIGLEWWEYKMYKFLLKSFLDKELDTSSHVYILKTL